MIDIETETLIDLQSACKLPVFVNQKTKKPAGMASMFRYVQRGARASNGDFVRLETIKTPTGRRTSIEAVERFIRLLTDPDGDIPVPTSKARSKQMAEAEAELAGAGYGS